MGIAGIKIRPGTPRQGCIDNPARCFLLFALVWSLGMAVLLCWGIWPEFSGGHDGGLVETRVHFRRWAISLGLIWLFVLLFTNLVIRKMAFGANALRRASRDLVCSEQESSRQEVLFESIFNAITDAVVFTDKDKRIVMVNPAFAELTGYSSSEVTGRPLDFLFSASGSSPGSRIHPGVRETLCYGKDGFSVPTEVFGSHVQDRDGDNIGFLLVLRDITSRRAAAAEHARMEAKLRQSFKMEAIGTLAGGIAHDFNNILGIIFINTEMAMAEVPEGNPARKNMERINMASRRARDLVQQILQYSRQSENKLIALMPGAMLKESLQFLRAGAPAGITVDHYVNDEFKTIMMDPARLKELLVNLFSNAVQALNGLGKIEIKATVVSLDVDVAAGSAQSDIPAGTYFRIMVRDTGTGMDPATRERMFDPFFTTREVGEGSGMGLASVLGIVHGHGGFITVDSEPGTGTAVRVFFPVVVEEEEETEDDLDGLSGTEHVLFVDDEEMLVEMACMFLRDRGFTVTEQAGSRAALDLFRADPATFDIIVTDQTMPDMTGSELAVEALRIRPDIPIILLSGYSRKISREEVLKLGIRDFLYKPFDGKAMVRAIRNVLDHDPS